MKTFLCFLLLASAYAFSKGRWLTVAHSVDKDNRWTAVLSNPHKNVVMTRIKGHVSVQNALTKRIVDVYRIPLEGVCLGYLEECKTYLPRPLPEGPFLVTCHMDFVDLKDSFDGSLLL